MCEKYGKTLQAFCKLYYKLLLHTEIVKFDCISNLLLWNMQQLLHLREQWLFVAASPSCMSVLLSIISTVHKVFLSYGALFLATSAPANLIASCFSFFTSTSAVHAARCLCCCAVSICTYTHTHTPCMFLCHEKKYSRLEFGVVRRTTSL